MDVIASVAGISLITPSRLENLALAVLRTKHVPGVMAELGVYRGGSAKVIAAMAPNKMLHLFDTFTGLPSTEYPHFNPTDVDLNRGRFACSREEAEATLADSKHAMHEGLFPESACDLRDLRFSFVHVDCDLFDSTRAAIDWFWPRMEPEGIMFFDDYGCEFTGVTEAVREAFTMDEIEEQTELATEIKIGALVVKP